MEKLNPDFVQPHRYRDIVDTLLDNVPNLKYLDSTMTISIKKKDMQFEVTHKEEMKELMTHMFMINNFICRQYRRRKHILKSTVILDG